MRGADSGFSIVAELGADSSNFLLKIRRKMVGFWNKPVETA
jgi:hypothetical protein